MAEGDTQLVRRGRRLVVSGHAKVQVHSFEPRAVLSAKPGTYTPDVICDTVGFLNVTPCSLVLASNFWGHAGPIFSVKLNGTALTANCRPY
jgi:hypothetical protein